MRRGPHHIGTAGASDGDFLGYDPDTDEYTPMAPPGGGSGTVESVVAGTGIAVDNADPANPVVSATGGGGGGGGVGYDRRWNIGSGETSIDEFNDNSLAGAWARVDGTGAAAGNLAWTEGADVVSAANAGGDTAACLHGLVRPLTGAGGALSAGDAFVACLSFLSPAANYAFGGLLLADGNTFGSGKQVAGIAGKSATSAVNAESWALAGWNSRSATAGSLQLTEPKVNYLRLAMIAANTWRTDTSPDGVSWIKGAATLAQTFTPTYVGLCSTSYGTSTKHVASFEFLRRVTGVT